VIVLFYFMKDGPFIWSFLITPLGPLLRAKARRAGDSAVVSLGGYVRGTAIVAAVDAACIGIALAVLRVPLAVPLAIVVFIGAFIPLVGATVAGIVSALVTLVTVDLSAAIWVAIVVVAVQQLEGNFLSPVVLGKSLRLHGLVVLLALTAGTILGGIIGTLLSVPTAAVAWAVITQWNDPIVPDPIAAGAAIDSGVITGG
jgi:predicted PurR-regulated permease PerM